jgi:chorismate dehydratase
MGRPKIGAVSYLNTKPLVAGLEDAARDFDLVFDLPSRLADRLATGELDVALIPVVEAVTNPRYTIVSDACIACRGPVWSVKLLSRVPGEQIKTLALDEGSRTSCTLARVFLDRKFGVRPDCRPLSIDEAWRLTDTDAVMIIGDRAMKADDPEFPYVWDLGESWKQWTGKPFVFAVWAAQPSSDLDRLDKTLSSARDHGLETLEKISSEQARQYDLSADECLRYLRDNLHFDLGAEEKSGMDLFFQYAADLLLIPQPIQLQFHDCQTAG